MEYTIIRRHLIYGKKELLGKAVVDSEAQNFGKIDDILLDLDQGKVMALIVRTGLRFLPNKRYDILPSEVDKVGDRLLLRVKKESVLRRAQMMKSEVT